MSASKDPIRPRGQTSQDPRPGTARQDGQSYRVAGSGRATRLGLWVLGGSGGALGSTETDGMGSLSLATIRRRRGGGGGGGGHWCEVGGGWVGSRYSFCCSAAPPVPVLVPRTVG